MELAAEIAQDRPAKAREIVARLREATLDLSDFPEVGRMVPELGAEQVRELVVPPWRVVYRVLPAEVHVLAVFHGRRVMPGDRAELTDDEP